MRQEVPFAKQRRFQLSWRVVMLSALAALPVANAADLGQSTVGSANSKPLARASLKAAQAENVAKADALVREALFREVYGETAERNQLLNDAAAIVPDYPLALWHKGFVSTRGHWLTVDNAIDVAAKNPLLKTYAKKRQGARDTASGNVQLAMWCASYHLDDQARAHFELALHYNPDNAIARANLGYRRFAGRWISQADMEKRVSDSDELQLALRKWMPPLAGILRGLLSNSGTVQASAYRQFSEITDTAAIPALERTFSLVNEDFALLLVDKLAEWNDPVATEAIARQAVFSPSEAVRQAAALKLKSRPKEEYVPQMLAVMFSPFRIVASATSMFGTGARAQPVHRMLMVREGQDATEATLMSSFYTVQQSHPNSPPGNELKNSENLTAIAQELRQTKQMLNKILTIDNLQTEQLNRQAMDALALATIQTQLTSPDQWWAWWDAENETVPGGPKPTIRANLERDVVINQDDPYAPPTIESSEFHESIPRVPPHSCFVAGTQVWTLTGAVPIEAVRVGDCVLSQNTESGELTFKPVLRKAIRQSSQVFKIESSGEALRATGGHLFWVAGEGWTKTRDLKSGQILHCATGTLQVSDTQEEAAPAQTFNLVVADFNTYFVGPEKILVHDVTERKPTRSIVPGLPRE